MGLVASVHELAGGGDSRGRLGRQGEAKSFQQESLVGVGFGVATQDQGAAIGGREVDIEHLDAGELVEHGTRGETRCQRLELCLQGDVQAIGHERDEPGLHGCNAFGRYRMRICASMRLSS
jgi:hypothetical protein